MADERDPAERVIHIDFRTKQRRSPRRAETPEKPSAQRSRDAREPITDLYTATEVCKLLGLSRSRLRRLDKLGVISPSGKRKGRRAYTFRDLIALRTAAKLFENHAKVGQVAEAVKALRERLPQVTRPLSELRITHDGRHLVVWDQEGPFEPETGQMVLDFKVKQLRNDVVETLRPAISVQRTRSAYELYLRATKLDEDPKTFDEAERLYREALRLDPYLAIAYTNMGNIWFRRKNDSKAIEMYEQALRVDPGQAEAHYNLGYVMLERQDWEKAVKHFELAIERDEKFSDAYFNLAMGLEGMGLKDRARDAWRSYLKLEPTGPWADFARDHLGLL